MQFDMHFHAVYPSISKDLLLKAIDYAKRFVNINDDETKTIMHSHLAHYTTIAYDLV